MGKRHQIKHFLDISRSSVENQQDKQLIKFEINNSVSPVSRVSIVSFRCAYDRSVNLGTGGFLSLCACDGPASGTKLARSLPEEPVDTEPRTEGVHLFEEICLFASDRPFTPARLAANRTNAQKFCPSSTPAATTGPRMAQGRNCIVLNGLKHSQHAGNFARSCPARSLRKTQSCSNGFWTKCIGPSVSRSAADRVVGAASVVRTRR
jgi:hypothetical protein